VILALFEFALQPSGLAVWFWLLCVIALVWTRRHIDLYRGQKEPVLRPADAAGANPLPRLSVLVAAKDEEANIGRCLEGLLAQDYPNLEIIIANDRSTDRTGAILDEFAARDTRIKPVHVPALPAGWGGKNHAMHLAMQQATGEYLCFSDADCRYVSTVLMAAAVRFAQRENIDFLSVLPELEAHTFWERVVQPPAGAIMVFWFPPQKVNNPDKPQAYANGAFMLMSRHAYEVLGGHEEAKAQLNEDMHFARIAKQRRLRLRAIRGDGMYTVRMYTGLRQIWNGWTRIFYCSFGTLPRLLVSVIFLSVFSLLPALSLLLSPLCGAQAGGIALAAGLAFVAQQTILWRFYALSRTPPWWALSYPLGAGLCLAITINALRRHGGVGTNWRGTTYQGGV
jgi:chlorobactene glucosyltransferase